MIKIAIDTGGTFTDYIVSGTFRCAPVENLFIKHLTNHNDLAKGFMEGLDKVARGLDVTLEELLKETSQIIHGSTLALNALLERKGVTTALFTTLGFRDALEIRRAQLKNQWNINPEIPDVLVPRRLRLGIHQRLDYKGQVIKELEEESVRQACHICRINEVNSIAVCYLFSFLNPEHEKKTAEIIQEELPHVFVTLSSDVSPKIREYERTSTTVLNAYLTPVLAKYLTRLEEKLSMYGWEKPIHIMMNSGGISDTHAMAKYAVKTLFSGPVGGACGNGDLRDIMERKQTVLADMGGTSFDLHISESCKNQLKPQGEIAGYPLTVPTVDIISIGAGGGSIAYIDSCGRIMIGPESAGSVPGPACYGLGGDKPTTTDVLLILGLMDEKSFLGGTIPLNRQRAEKAMDENIAKPLSISVKEAANVIYQIATEKMADALRIVTVQKGINPKEITLIGAGGAFGLFAGTLMDRLHIQEVLFPITAPVFCAWGMMGAPRRADKSKSFLMDKSKWNVKSLNKNINDMHREGIKELARLGVFEEELEVHLTLEMRYIGQHHEISIPWQGVFQYNDLIKLDMLFHEKHGEYYGYMEKDKDWEIMHLHLACIEQKPRTKLPIPGYNELSVEFREVSGEPFRMEGEQLIPVYQNRAMNYSLENVVTGPALMQMEYTSIMVPKGFIIRTDKKGLLSMIKLEGEQI